MRAIDMTEEQCREEIVHNLDLNMFVEAGAGAGKTTLIVKRVINQLKNGYKPGEIVVITFTKAAAEELRERISNAVMRENMPEVFSHLDEMNISTIHSLCSTILKEHCLLAGIPFDLTVLEEEEATAEHQKYFSAYLATLKREDWDKLEEYTPEGTFRSSIKSDMFALFENMCGFPEDVEVIMPKTEGLIAEADAFLEDLENYRSNFKNLLLTHGRRCYKAGNPVTLADLLSDERICSKRLAALIESYGETDVEQAQTAFLSALKQTSGFFSKSKAIAIHQKDEFDSINQDLQEALKPQAELIMKISCSNSGKKKKNALELLRDGIDREKHYEIVVSYVQKAIAYYREHRDYGRLSNDDLLVYTRKLVCGADFDLSGLAYRCFYVDEFQDTDRIQESFIYRLATDPADPEHRKLRDGTLFVVGDPKQSIYRFRGAQPEVYFQLKERMAQEDMTNAKVYELAKNFRSNSTLIEWVNEKFTAADAETPIAGAQHPYTKMDAVKGVFPNPADPDKLLAGVYRYQRADTLREVQVQKKAGAPFETEYEYNEYAPESDVEAVVSLVKTLKAEGYRITDYDEKNNYAPYEREVQYRDFLLLCRNKDRMEEYLEALLREGIPVKFDGSETLLLDRELTVFVRLYRYLANRSDAYARVAASEALRNSALADKEAELSRYSEALLSQLYEGAKGKTAYGKAVFLERKLVALLEKNREYPYLKIYMFQTRLRQMIENVFHDNCGTAEELAEVFQSYLEKQLEHELSLEEDADAVRFMNVHKAKGLEGNIVIILDRTGKNKKPVVSIMDGDRYYAGFQIKKFYKQWSSVSQLDEYTDMYQEQVSEEEHRLEYVAVTRAKQVVIFMNSLRRWGLFAKQVLTKKKDPPYEGFNYRIEDCPSLEELIERGIGNLGAGVDSGDALGFDDLTKASGSGSPKPVTPASAVYNMQNPSKLELTSSTRAYDYAQSAKRAGRRREDDQSRALPRPIGNIMGNVLHRTMELLVGRYRREWSDEEKARMVANVSAEQAVRENARDIEGNPDEYSRFVSAAAYAYYRWLEKLDSENGIEAFYTELPFSYYDPRWETKDGETRIWMNGTADLLVKYSDGRVGVIDYKSDNDWLLTERQMEECLREKYSPQLAVYRKVASRMFGCAQESVSVGIVSFSQKTEEGEVFADDAVRIRYTSLS